MINPIEKYTLKVNYGKKELPTEKIRYIVSVHGNYSIIHFGDGKEYLSAFTLKHYQQQLTPEQFQLGRKGLLINLDYLESLAEDEQQTKYAKLTTGETFKLSRRKGKELEEKVMSNLNNVL